MQHCLESVHTMHCHHQPGCLPCVPQAAGSGAARSDQAGSRQGEAGSSGKQQPFLLPLMTLSKVKLPTESVPLQIFEPRFRWGPWQVHTCAQLPH